jgi:outer membrane immunogenic protein
MQYSKALITLLLVRRKFSNKDLIMTHKYSALTSLTLAAALTGTATFAGSLEAPTPDARVAPEAAAVTDFSGSYVGASVGSITSGEGTYMYDGVPGDFYALEGNGYGLFAGHNWQRGALVYGAEIAFTSMNGEMPSADPGTFLKSAIDLKGRLGYVFGNALAYGFVGYSSGDWTNAPSNPLTNPNLSGMNYGAGIDYKINDWTVGAEYIHRKMDAGFNENSNGIEADFGMVQLRVSYKF